MNGGGAMKIAVGGSAANPPHLGHRMLVEAVIRTGKYDKVIWTVSGDRPDKPGLPDPKLRWEMGKIIMGHSGKILRVSYEPERSVPTFRVIVDLQTCYKEAEIVWYCGADHFLPRERFKGDCDVLGFWDEGKYLFENQKFLIIPRKGLDMDRLQLPKRYEILEADIPEISSTDIRRHIKNGERVDHLTAKEVEDYIYEKKLYQE